jgi:hypothetical protein
MAAHQMAFCFGITVVKSFCGATGSVGPVD